MITSRTCPAIYHGATAISIKSAPRGFRTHGTVRNHGQERGKARSETIRQPARWEKSEPTWEAKGLLGRKCKWIPAHERRGGEMQRENRESKAHPNREEATRGLFAPTPALQSPFSANRENLSLT